MSETLARACAYMVETKAIDELEKLVEADAFEAWLVEMETEIPQDDVRIKYHAQRELLQHIRNLATVSNRQDGE